MVSPNIALWLNRFGILLNIVSFVLLTPELIGQKRLMKLEGTVERFVEWLRPRGKILVGYIRDIKLFFERDDYKGEYEWLILMVSLVVPWWVGMPMFFLAIAWSGAKIVTTPVYPHLFGNPYSYIYDKFFNSTIFSIENFVGGVLDVGSVFCLSLFVVGVVVIFLKHPKLRVVFLGALVFFLLVMGLGMLSGEKVEWDEWNRLSLSERIIGIEWVVGMMVVIFCYIVYLIVEWIQEIESEFFRWLRDDENITKRWAVIGVLLFFVGSLVQLIATF